MVDTAVRCMHKLIRIFLHPLRVVSQLADGARAASGHATAELPRSVMNLRRWITRSPRRRVARTYPTQQRAPLSQHCRFFRYLARYVDWRRANVVRAGDNSK